MVQQKASRCRSVLVYKKTENAFGPKLPKYRRTMHIVGNSDEFELKFPKLSQAKLKMFQAQLSQAGAFQFSSWNQADKMYIN